MCKTNKATINEAACEPSPSGELISLHLLASIGKLLQFDSLSLFRVSVFALSRFVTTGRADGWTAEPSPGRTWTLVVVFVVEWLPSLSSSEMAVSSAQTGGDPTMGLVIVVVVVVAASGASICCAAATLVVAAAVTSRWISIILWLARFSLAGNKLEELRARPPLQDSHSQLERHF